MEFQTTTIPGLLTIKLVRRGDERGAFVKSYTRDPFEEHGIHFACAEIYHSVSARDVVRGLHFQIPPHDHAKIVTCLQGEIVDAVVDIRRSSPTFGQHQTFTLSAEYPIALVVPRGCAHGFCVTSESALVLYAQDSVYAPDHDCGVRWDSAGIVWPVTHPILSPRDAQFPGLAEFDSPFTYDAVGL